MFYLKEGRVEYIYQSLTRNPKKIHCSVLLCEILIKCLTEPNIELYQFIIDGFKFFDQQKNNWVGFDSLFLIKLCSTLGIQPLMNNVSTQTPFILNLQGGCFESFVGQGEGEAVPQKESLEIYNLSKLSFQDLEFYSLPEDLNYRVLNYLILYISNHLCDLSKLKSLKILKQLN